MVTLLCLLEASNILTIPYLLVQGYPILSCWDPWNGRNPII